MSLQRQIARKTRLTLVASGGTCLLFLLVATCGAAIRAEQAADEAKTKVSKDAAQPAKKAAVKLGLAINEPVPSRDTRSSAP